MMAFTGERLAMPTLPKELEAAVHYCVCKVVDDLSSGKTTKAFKYLLGQIVLERLTATAGDFNAFSQHAQRSKVTISDALMLARRNKSLVRVCA
jgi:hypothetical protein